MNSRSISLVLAAVAISTTSALMGSPFSTARPEMSEQASGVFAFGEFLYWKAKEEGLSYGLQSPASYRTDPSKGVFGSISQIKPHFQPGFRLGIDFNFNHDQWDILLHLTSYQSSKKSHISELTQELVWPYFLDSHGSPTAL